MFKAKSVIIATVMLPLLLVTTLAPAPAHAQTRRGFFLGAGAGVGSGLLDRKIGNTSTTEDGLTGGVGSLRLGYAFSSKLALSLDGHTFTTTDRGSDWDVSTLVLALSWYPCANGFFVRLGAGGGGGHVSLPVTGNRVSLDSESVGLLSLGYDFRLGEHTSLGLAGEVLGMTADSISSLTEDSIGIGALSLQFTWHP